MGYSWILRLPLMIITRIKEEFSDSILEKYKMDKTSNFSSVDSSNTNAIFPFVFIRQLESRETSKDLEGTSINGGIFGFQIEVTDNKSQSNARNIMSEIVRIMKKMSFEVVGFPIYEDTKDTHLCIMRFRRSIDEGDIL